LLLLLLTGVLLLLGCIMVRVGWRGPNTGQMMKSITVAMRLSLVAETTWLLPTGRFTHYYNYQTNFSQTQGGFKTCHFN
jgi:hypothetical protein